MTKTSDPHLAQRLQDRAAINAALCRGVRDALERHRQAGVPAVVWEDGQIVVIPAEQVRVDAVHPPVKDGDHVSVVTAIAGG